MTTLLDAPMDGYCGNEAQTRQPLTLLHPRELFGQEDRTAPDDSYQRGTGQPRTFVVTEERVAQVERLLRGHRPIDTIVEQTGLTRHVVELIRDRTNGRTLPDHHKTARAYVKSVLQARKGGAS